MQTKIDVILSSSINKWVVFLNIHLCRHQNIIPTKLTLDFSNCSSKIMPYHIVSLACLIEEYSMESTEIDFIKGDNEACIYLDQIRFFEYWKPGFNRTRFNYSNISSNFCLWHINKERIHSYCLHAQQFLETNCFEGLSLFQLHETLKEIFNNLFDHSKSKVDGYVLTQYFPKSANIILSVCDFGIGIPKLVNTYLKQTENRILENTEALKKSFELGFSTKSTPSNRGFGLDTLSSIVKDLKGELKYISNNAILIQDKNGIITTTQMNEYHPGTQAVISLDTSALPLKEEESEEEFNF